MRKPASPFFLIASGLVVSLVSMAGCQSRPAEPPAPTYAPAATIKDIMDAIVDPSADVVWESVATVVTPSGTEERQPKTDEEWTNVRRGAIRLVEGANLLLMPGRHVAREHEKSEVPGIELEPAEMEAHINKDRAKWEKHVKELYTQTLAALKAIEAKDPKALVDIGERIDGACENCHVTYWYPNQVLPPGYEEPAPLHPEASRKKSQ
jgi:hypothetical protein